MNPSFNLTAIDKEKLCKLTVPVGYDEEERIRILRQSMLLDSSTNDPEYDRYTAFCRRLFQVLLQYFAHYTFLS